MADGIFCPANPAHLKLYADMVENVGEDRAASLYSATGGEPSDALLEKLRNVTDLERMAEEAGETVDGARAKVFNNSQHVNNLTIETGTKTLIEKAIDLLENKKTALYYTNTDRTEAAQNALKVQIALIEEDIRLLKKEKKISDIAYIGDRLITLVKDMLANSSTISATGLVQAQHSLDIVTSITDTLLDMKSVEADGKIVYKLDNEAVIETAEGLRKETTALLDNLREKKVSAIITLARQLGNTGISVGELKALKSESYLKATFGHTAEFDNKLAQLLSQLLQNMESNAITEASEKLLGRIDKAVEAMGKNDPNSKENTQKLLQLNDKGERTGKMIQRYDYKYEKRMKEIEAALENNTDLSIDGFNTSVSTAMTDMIIADGFKLALGGEAMEQELARLRENLDEEVVQDMVEEALRKQREWETQKELIFERFKGYMERGKDGFETIEKMKHRYEQYLNNYGPDGFVDYIETGNKKKKKTYINAFKYIATAPKKTATEFYDSRFEELKKDTQLYNYYTTITEVFNESLKVLPSHATRHLGSNYLPEIDVAFIDTIGKDSFGKASAVLYHKMMKMISVNPRMSEFAIDDGKGNKIPMLPIRYSDDRVGRMHDKLIDIDTEIRVLIGKIDWKEAAIEDYKSKKIGTEALEKEVAANIKELAQLRIDRDKINEAYKMALANKSFNITDAMRSFAMMATMYKHRAEVKDVAMIVQSKVEESYAAQVDSNGNLKRDEEGRPIPANVRDAKTLEAIRYATDSYLFDKKKEEKKGTGRLVATNPEGKKILKKMKEDIKVAKEHLFSGNITNAEYDVIVAEIREEAASHHGIGNASFQRILDNLTQIAFFRGMGWNIRSAFGNVLIGKIANVVEAASGEFFNKQDQAKAATELNAAIKNSIGIKNEKAKKIANLMHKYGIMFKNLESAYGGAQNTGKTMEKLGIFAPMELQKRGEYYNQANTLLAILFNTKVKTKDGKEISLYEAYDNDGLISSDIDGAEQWETIDSSLKYNKFTKLRSRSVEVMRKLHGNYDAPMLMKKTAVGRALMGFKTWLPAAIESRGGREYFNESLGVMVKGRYRSGIDLFKNRGFIPALNIMTKILINDVIKKQTDPSYTGLTSTDLANLKRNAKELQILLGLIAMYLVANLALVDDDDEEETAWTTKIALDMITRAQSDITLFVNPSAMSTAIVALPPALKWVKDVYNIPFAVARATSSDDERYDTWYGAKAVFKPLPFGSQVTSISGVIEKGVK